MARQRDSKLVGTVDNLIFYYHRGDYRMRTKPVSVKRTPASINSGLNFGKASKMSKQIRSLIAPINPSKSDGRASYRLTGAINKFISWKQKRDPASPVPQNGLPFIQGFQFNDQADLTSISAIRASVNTTQPGLMEIRLAPFVPTEALHAPYNTDHIVFKMILTATNLAEVETEKLGTAEIEIPYNIKSFQPPVISIPVGTKPGRLTMMVLAVQYMLNKKNGIKMLINPKKLPCGVVWAG